MAIRWPWTRATVARANPAWPVILEEIGAYTEEWQQPPFEQDFDQYLQAVKLMPTFMAAVTKIVAAAQDVPWVYCDARTDEPIDPQRSKLAQVFDGYLPARPNPLAGPRTFRAELFQQRVFFGEAYIYFDGSPVNVSEAMVLRSASCGPVASKDPKVQILRFEYGMHTGRKVQLDRNLVVFSRRPHPADPLRGMSPIAELEQTFRALAPFYGLQASIMKNGPRIPGVLLLKGNVRMTREERKRLEDDFNAKHSGEKAGRIAILQAEDADLKPTGMTMDQAEVPELYDVMRREIFNVLQVPPGLFDSKDVNRSNMREQRALLYTDAVRPMVDAVLDDVNRHPWPLAVGEYIKADWEQVEALQPNQLEEAQSIGTLVDKRILTRNEARERLGLAPVEGGDEFPEPVNPLAAFGPGGSNGNGKAPLPAEEPADA